MAVIVVLAIIALIATPIILNIIEKSKVGAAEQSTTAYVKAVENSIIVDLLKEEEHIDGKYYVKSTDGQSISVNLNGTLPTGGSYDLEKGKIKSGVFCVSGYRIEYGAGFSKKTADDCGDLVSTLVYASNINYTNANHPVNSKGEVIDTVDKALDDLYEKIGD